MTRTGAARPAYEELAAALRAQILSGELSPGDRLPVEPDLSAKYGVSRSTVREALRVLSSQHLITTTRGVVGGSFVAHPQPEQISGYLETGLSLMSLFEGISVDQLLQVRDILEVPAAGLAAGQRSAEQLDELPSKRGSRPVMPSVVRIFSWSPLEATQNGTPIVSIAYSMPASTVTPF